MWAVSASQAANLPNIELAFSILFNIAFIYYIDRLNHIHVLRFSDNVLTIFWQAPSAFNC